MSQKSADDFLTKQVAASELKEQLRQHLEAVATLMNEGTAKGLASAFTVGPDATGKLVVQMLKVSVEV